MCSSDLRWKCIVLRAGKHLSCALRFVTGLECWTDWFDRDDPTGNGDFETLVDLRSEYPGKICPSPVQIEVTTISGVSHTATGNVFAA